MKFLGKDLMGETPPEMADKIDARSAELIDEFYEYLDEVRASGKGKRAKGRREDVDAEMRTVFESWCIQKLASLQLMIINHVERIEQLEQSKRR